MTCIERHKVGIAKESIVCRYTECVYHHVFITVCVYIMLFTR